MFQIATSARSATRRIYDRRHASSMLQCTVTLAVLLFSFAICTPLSVLAQVTLDRSQLEATPQKELTTFWRVQDASFREDFGGVAAAIAIRNVWNKPLDDAAFYAEYFDAAGRFCLSLLLTEEKISRDAGPIRPGEVGHFGALTSGLFPASEPKKVNLYLVRQRISDQASVLQKWETPIRVPVTIAGSVDATLQLNSVSTGQQPFVDLVFGRVEVDERGNVGSVTILRSVSDELTLWFLTFIRQKVPFYPARDGARFKRSEVLVMVRALLSSSVGDVRSLPFLPDRSPSLTNYLANLAQNEIPAVLNFVFTPPIKSVKQNGQSAAPASVVFEERLPIGGWSEGAFKYIRDASMPRNLRREFKDE